MPGTWIVAAVRLGAEFVADEDHWPAPVIEFLEMGLGVLHVNHAPERAQMAHRQVPASLQLVRSFDTDALARSSVEEVHRGAHSLPPKHPRETLGFEHGAHSFVGASKAP